jgi:mRNA interferase YafQ
MRAIERSSAFRRDYKREIKGQHRKTLDDDLVLVLMGLANDHPLEPRHCDHGLSGDCDWDDYRECHVNT